MFNPIEYVKQIIKEYNKDIDTRPTSAMYELVVMPLASLYTSIQREIDYIFSSRSISNASEIPEDEMDLLMSNLFISRNDGSKATGKVYYYFASPRDILIPDGAILSTDDGVSFYVTEAVSITSGAMSVNKMYGMYYVSAPIEADGYGEQYNISANAITNSDFEIAGLIKVTNPLPITGGSERETNEQFAERAETAVVSRNLLSDRSINTVLMDKFEFLKRIDIVGFGDSEMERDKQTVLVNGTEYDLSIGGCVDIYLDTGSIEESTITSDMSSLPGGTPGEDNDKYIPISKVRASGISGSVEIIPGGNDVFTDVNARFDIAGIAEDDVLVIYNDIDKQELRILSVDGYGTLTLKDNANNSGSDLEYSVLSSAYSEGIVLSMVDVKTTDGGIENEMTDGTGFDVEVKTIVDNINSVKSSISGDTVHMVKSYNGELKALYLDYHLDNPSGEIDISNLSESYSENICSVSTDTAAIVRKEESGDIMLSIIDFASNSVLSDNIIFTDDASHVYDKPFVAHTYDGTDHFIYVFAADADSALVSNNIICNKYVLNTSTGSIGAPIILGYIIMSGVDGAYPVGMDVDSNNDHISVAVQISSTNASIVYLNTDLSFAGTASNAFAANGMSSISISIDLYDNVMYAWVDGLNKVIYNKTRIQHSDFYSGTIAESQYRITYQDSKLDISGKMHTAYIDTNNNSGDIRYVKKSYNGEPILSDDIVNDQYRNADFVLLNVSESRKPFIFWSSFDLYDKRLDGCRKDSQDYYLKSMDEFKRFSNEEILSLVIDENVAYGICEAAFYHPTNIDSVTKFVSDRDSIDRVVTANYLVKSNIPCVIDISLTYEGEDTDIKEQIESMILNSTDYNIYASDIIAALELDSEEHIVVPFNMVAKLYNADGTVSVYRSQDGFSFSRMTRFIPGLIEVS